MKTVLIIDDDDALRSVVGLWLETHGWKVFTAENGDVGMSLAMQHRPDIVLVDLRMPRANGFQVCRWIRAQAELLAHTLIIVTAGSDYDLDKRNAFEAGADEYVVKPFKPAELLALMNRLTSEPAAQETPVASVTPAGDTATRVKFWGVRGSIPTPGPATLRYGGNTACVEVRAGEEIIILDAGTGVRPLGLALAREFKGRSLHVSFLISHTHWDHIQGFPFFAPAYNPKNRIRVLGYEGARKGLETTLSGQMESPYFPITMRQMPSHITFEELKDLEFTIGNVGVRAVYLHHPDICMGYRLVTSGGSVAYLPDYEPFSRMLSEPAARSDTELTERRAFAQTEDDKLAEFVREVDALIVDSQYDQNEYPLHTGWGHSCLDDSVALAIRAKVRHLFLFHHDPNHDDEHIARMVDRAREIAVRRGATLQIDAAREGYECSLPTAPPPAA